MEKQIIRKIEDAFVLDTLNTTYAFRVNPRCGALEHLYYGRKIHINSAEEIAKKHAFASGDTICYENGKNDISLEDLCLEFSTYGKGDTRESMIDVVNSDGSSTLDFHFAGYEIIDGKHELDTLPCSYDDKDEVKTLKVVLKDEENELELNLYYSVFENSNIITRSAKLINNGSTSIRLNKMLSSLIDFSSYGYAFSTFNGAWAREMKKTDTVVNAGKLVNSSFCGTSSNHANPFVMLSEEKVTEDHGNCYGFNLIYSGNHYEAVEVNAFSKTRFVQGINPQGFEFIIDAGESFEAPEAVMTFSYEGYNGLSSNMHQFVRKHIVRGEYKNKKRPVLLNSWEASYFDINQNNLLKLAKAGKDVGIELFVMDDGWFGERNDDTSSLGDWDVNLKKLPGGLKGLCDKVKELGLDFGIWVEPEMISVKSRLYEKHPDWAMEIPGKGHSEGRNQRILDLSREDVQDFVIEKMTEVFNSADIKYVKWDMNRNFSDVYSSSLSKDRQGEVFHRYVMGLYRCMKTLTERFPSILFEGCSSGGNRFDLGILCYFPQIWASDNTDAMCRSEIQNGYSYGYPLSTIGAHVSGAPNHQTLRNTPLETRFNVAAFGVLGYECNLCDLKKEELDAIKKQISLYKEYREVLQFGQFYRGRSFSNEEGMLSNNDSFMEWICVSEDKDKAVGMLLQKLVVPNSGQHFFKARGLDEASLYHVTTRDIKHSIKEFGDLVNTISPVHIKPDSVIQNVASKFVKMDSAVTDVKMYGDELMYSGVKMAQSYSGTGFNDEVRIFQDFGSELFMIKNICK